MDVLRVFIFIAWPGCVLLSLATWSDVTIFPAGPSQSGRSSQARRPKPPHRHRSGLSQDKDHRRAQPVPVMVSLVLSFFDPQPSMMDVVGRDTRAVLELP